MYFHIYHKTYVRSFEMMKKEENLAGGEEEEININIHLLWKRFSLKSCHEIFFFRVKISSFIKRNTASIVSHSKDIKMKENNNGNILENAKTSHR